VLALSDDVTEDATEDAAANLLLVVLVVGSFAQEAALMPCPASISSPFGRAVASTVKISAAAPSLEAGLVFFRAAASEPCHDHDFPPLQTVPAIAAAPMLPADKMAVASSVGKTVGLLRM
jgi:hypothetical protein